MKPAWLLCLTLACCKSYAVDNNLNFNDALQDDTGNGSLIYPHRNDFQSGDLDLTSLAIKQAADGYWFRAEFKNTIRNPAKVTTDGGPEPLKDFARKGFYNFNIDIYIDFDRVTSSGNMFTLPGRHVFITADYAWERAVILTPRPEQMRSILIEELVQRYPELPAHVISDKINALVYFPDQIKVRGKSISFFVPQKHLGTSQADQWAITAFVTGAQTSIPSNLSLFNSATPSIDSVELGVMQLASGRPANNFGYTGNNKPSPIVDLLTTTPIEQIKQLSQMPVRLSGIASTATASSVNASPVTSFAELLGAIPSAATPITKTDPPATEKPAIGQRLETLQKLFDNRLISNDEYQQQRQRILNEL